MRPTCYHCSIFRPGPRSKKTCVYKRSMHFCQERVGWSGCGVEQKSGTLHLFNLSNFDLLGFQILMIWDLWGINFHTVVVLALIFHLWFKLLSALCDTKPHKNYHLFLCLFWVLRLSGTLECLLFHFCLMFTYGN